MAKNIYVGVNNVARKVVKAYVGVNYKPVEYIESTGTQYIDTGLNLYETQGYHIKTEVEFTDLDGTFQVISGTFLSDADRCILRANNDNKIVTHFRYYSGDNVMEGPIAQEDQVYTIEAKLYSGAQFLKVDGTTYATKSVTGTFVNDINVYMFAINSKFSVDSWAKIKMYSAKFYDSNGNLIRDYIPVLDENDVPCLFDKVEHKAYYNKGTGDFLYGSRTADPEVTGAREIKKAHVGVNGVAQQFYQKSPTYITFTRSPIPTGWAGSGTAANSSFTGTNTYGTWTCKMDKAAYSTTYLCSKAFDYDAATYTRPSSSVSDWVQLYLPTGITINPTKIVVNVANIKSGSRIEGRNAATGSWETFYTQSTNIGSTATDITANISTANYYNAFAVNAQYYSSYPKIYGFKIVTGTIKDDR